MEDVERLTSREDSWTLTILVSSGAQEPSYPTSFHYSAGGAKGDESFEGDNLVVKNMVAYCAFYEDAFAQIKEKFDIDSDHQRYHDCSSSRLYLRKFEKGKGSENNIVLRVAWSVCLWDSRRIAIAKTLADAVNRHFEADVTKECSVSLKSKKRGY